MTIPSVTVKKAPLSPVADRPCTSEGVCREYNPLRGRFLVQNKESVVKVAEETVIVGESAREPQVSVPVADDGELATK
jgi:hypothetical protein